MNLQRWRSIGEIYHSAQPLIASDRRAFVDRACGSDTSLRDEVNSLLEADESSGDFLESSAFKLGLMVLMADASTNSNTYIDADATPSDKLVGTAVDGRYLIVKELGHGGVGAVYLARDRKLHDKPVVVKVLLEKSAHNEWAVQKFQQEKEALARVDHPGVVGILDTGALPDGNAYIAMQYIEGMALREAIKAEPEGLALERSASIIRQIGAALSAVHEKKIYHRDLKPENIMLQALGRGEEQVKIVDFGIAKIRESVIAPSTITGAATAGTIVYMSPEQLRGERVSAASDIYSLGIIAYEIVTGRRPFNPQTIAHLAELQRQGVRAKPADLRPQLSQEAESSILKALAFAPHERHQSAAEFGNALSLALMNEEETLQQKKTIGFPSTELVHEQPPGAPENQQRQSTKWIRGFAISAGLLVAIGLLASWYVATWRSSWFGRVLEDGRISVNRRSLTYSLTVQKMRDGRPYQEPFESSGQEIFENGYKFRLNTSSPQSGYLYVFNQGAEKDGLSFTIIYPTPLTNQGSAKLDANQMMRTNWNTFAGQPGTEQFWIVWSSSPVTELEDARDAAFKSPEGAIEDPAMITSLRNFLIKHSEPKPETTKDTLKQQTNINGNNDLLVKLLELEHR